MICKAFALTGRLVCVHEYLGRGPGLGASALSGRVGQNLQKFSKVALSPLQQNIDDDGGTEQRGDGIQGDDATARREGAEEIAEKGKD